MKKSITEDEHLDLLDKVKGEGGVAAYLTEGTPDLELLEKLGFDPKKIKAMIELLEEIEERVFEAEEYLDGDEEFDDVEDELE